MYKHRLVFTGAWLLGVLALIKYPGHECRGLAWGLIVGHWPFVFLGEIGVWTTLACMFFLSAMEVGFCAWMMDRGKLGNKMWGVLLVLAMTGGMLEYFHNVDDFEAWRNSIPLPGDRPPEDNELTVMDFRNQYLVPKMIVGGMAGFYLTTAWGCLCAIRLILLKKARALLPVFQRASHRRGRLCSIFETLERSLS